MRIWRSYKLEKVLDNELAGFAFWSIKSQPKSLLCKNTSPCSGRTLPQTTTTSDASSGSQVPKVLRIPKLAIQKLARAPRRKTGKKKDRETVAERPLLKEKRQRDDGQVHAPVSESNMDLGTPEDPAGTRQNGGQTKHLAGSVYKWLQSWIMPKLPGSPQSVGTFRTEAVDCADTRRVEERKRDLRQQDQGREAAERESNAFFCPGPRARAVPARASSARHRARRRSSGRHAGWCRPVASSSLEAGSRWRGLQVPRRRGLLVVAAGPAGGCASPGFQHESDYQCA